MRFIYSLFLIFFVGVGLSASNNRSLEWLRNTASKTTVPDFENSVHAENQLLPLYSETQNPAIFAAAFTAKLRFPVFQKLSSEELRLLRPYLRNFPDSIEIKVSLGMQRKKQVLDLSFYPFIKKGNDYLKVISFEWDIRPVVSGLRSATVLNTTREYADTSVLASGTWKKISVSETGIYKLTYQDIKGMGIDPDFVQIYGYGGALLKEDFSLSGYMDDLPEVAIWKELGSDGLFNAGDFILFYAQGPISWACNETSDMFSRVRNHYSDKAYYFIGQRALGTKTAAFSTFTGVPNKEITSFTDFLLHETERVNIGESVASSGTGRELYGEDFTTSPIRSFSFNVPDADTTERSKIQVEFVAHNTGASSCGVSVNNVRLTTLSMRSIEVSNAYTYAAKGNNVASFIQKGETVTVKLDYGKNGFSSVHRAYLNYIVLNMRRFLKMEGSSQIFRDPESVGTGNIGRFTIQNSNNNTAVFDVTNPLEMVQMVRLNGTLNDTNYVFIASTSTLREYVCVDLNGTFSKPTIVGSVPNQNIHGSPQVDLVIIAPSEFTSYATTLAQAHSVHDNLSFLVVTPEQVFNEFSSGTPDATAYRRMMKLFYDRGDSTNDNLPKYLLLFGDGVYDNRLVSTMFSNSSFHPNKILTYQSIESLEGSQSFVTDDYFGFLDDSEGSNLSTAKLDIGIGRFPVSTVEQAKAAVDKTISYMENKQKGVWKSRLLYLGDDGDENLHVTQADNLATMVEINHPEFMVNKIYVDAYNKVNTTSGSTVPDANMRFAELLNSGVLMLNYTGHGSTSQWTHEKLLTSTEVSTMTNKRLPLWVTATCDFSRFDAPEMSGGEYVFLNPVGGGIALFSTTRIVYSSYNYLINRSFVDCIFAKNNGVQYSLGEIMILSKGTESLKNDGNKLNFTLIGDPALKLAYPEYSIRVTKVNGKDITPFQDTLHALSTVSVFGKVFREDGTFAEDFSGLVYPTVFDVQEIVRTLGSDGSNIFSFKDRSKVLFSGKDSVVNGVFSFSFVVPKDISYSFKTGRINLYAYDASGRNEAQGYFDNFVLGGTDVSAGLNTTGPEINLYLNDLNFVSGEKVNETPTFIARISDENGLNTSGNGIGHDLMLIVDDSPSMTYPLNNYYSADIGSYTSGVVQFVLPELSAGKHHLSFKAWDVQNNSNLDTLLFVVEPGMSPSVSNLRYAQRGESAWFTFYHNRPDVSESVKMIIYDLLGRALWNTTWSMQTSESVSDTLEWNLTDKNGRRVPNGIYICKVLVTDSNGAQTSGAKKIRVASQ